MRILFLTVLALAAPELKAFTGHHRSSKPSTALPMSSYLDSLNAYTAYQHQKSLVSPPAVNGGNNGAAMAKIAPTTVAPPKMAEANPVLPLSVNPPLKDEPKVVNPFAAPAVKAAPIPTRDAIGKSKVPLPPESIVMPGAVSFGGGERRIADPETNQLINSIGFFVTISLYVGIPLALFGLPPEAFLNKVEGKITEILGSGGSSSSESSSLDALIKRGFVLQDPQTRPSGVALDGLGGVSYLWNKFQGWVDREVALSKNLQKADVESIRARLLMSEYYNGRYESFGISSTYSPRVVAKPPAPAPAVQAPAPVVETAEPEVEMVPPAPVVSAIAPTVESPTEPVATVVPEATASPAETAAPSGEATAPTEEAPSVEASATMAPSDVQALAAEPQITVAPPTPAVETPSPAEPEYPSTPLLQVPDLVGGQVNTEPASIQEAQPVYWQSQALGQGYFYGGSTEEETKAAGWQDSFYYQLSPEQARTGSWEEQNYNVLQDEEAIPWQAPYYYEEYRDESLF